MKLKNTLFLLLLAGALFAFIKYYESGQLSSREAQEQAGRVVTFNRDDVNAIAIKNTENKIELRKDDKGVWRVEEPVKDRADSLAVSQLFTTAEALRYDAVIGDEKSGAEKDQLKDYGLLNSETKVRFSGKDKTIELVFGKDAAIEGKVYVKREGVNRAYVIGKDLKEQISKKVDDFRDRKLTDLNTAQVNKLVIKTGAGEIEAEKKDQHWTLVKPLKARADDAMVGDLVSMAATAHIDTFLADSATSNNYGLQDPKATVSLWTEGEDRPTLIQLGSNQSEEKDRERTYAKASVRDSIVLLPKSIERLANTKPNDLRDKNLVRFEADIVDRINIEGAGREKIVLARKGESWVRKVGGKDESINVAAARQLLDELRTQRVAAFVADVATDLPKYGLDQPKIKLTLSSYASENTAETKAGEKPIAALLFGKVEDAIVYARLEDEPFIVSIPQVFLEAVMTDPVQWQPLEIYHYSPDDITSVAVTKEGQAPIILERAKDKSWKLAKGDGTVSQINAQSLVNTLSNLRAVRWVGAAKPEDGLDKPSLTVAFKTAGGDQGKLSAGPIAPDAGPSAAAEGRSGVFEMSKPDLTAFQLALLEKAAATPGAPPSPGSPSTPPQTPASPAPTTETPAPAPQPPAPPPQ